jgi:hypothetical protein
MTESSMKHDMTTLILFETEKPNGHSTTLFDYFPLAR